MAFVTVNLVDYPRFWYDFVARLAAVDPSAAFHDLDIECYAADWYGIDCRIEPDFMPTGKVSMDSRSFTAFALQWAS